MIKIERPGVGEFARADDDRVNGLVSHCVWTNRFKESLPPDVKNAEAARVLQRLGLSFEALAPTQPVMPGLHNERESQVFCAQVLQQPLLATDPRFDSDARRTAGRESLREISVAAFASLTAVQAVQAVQRLEVAGIAKAAVNTMADVWAHAQLQARGRWVDVQTPSGTIPALLPPGGFASFSPRMDPVPAIGQHTDAILAELGYDTTETARLHFEAAV